MASLLSRFLAACACAFAAAGVCAHASAAPEQGPKAKPAAKAKAKKSTRAGAAAAVAAAAVAIPAADAADVDEPDITDTVVTDYQCELNNKITIYTNANDDAHIALRWKKRLHRLSRVGTTTGALRFENPYWGLVWIGIPAKGILLDSKLNRQLANECKNAEQSAPVVASLPAEKKS
jgi:membrane-bound inhibitor of C-type lysozyme